MTNNYDAKIWGPHYWFFLHSVASIYPEHPNDIIKKKFYNLIQNFYEFIPNSEMSNNFIQLLKKYPVEPYLDNKTSLMIWVNFIHNVVNDKLERPKLSFDEMIQFYKEIYKSPQIKNQEWLQLKKQLCVGGTLSILIGTIWYLYDK